MSTPPQTTTGPAVRTTTTEQTGIHYSTLYLHTIPGALKAVCLICTLIAFVITQFHYTNGTGIFSFATIFAFFFTGILLVLYLIHAIYVFNKIPWTKIEFFYCIAIALCLMISSAIIISNNNGWLTAAGFFGFLAMVAYLVDAFLKYQMYNVVVTSAVTRTTTVTVA